MGDGLFEFCLAVQNEMIYTFFIRLILSKKKMVSSVIPKKN